MKFILAIMLVATVTALESGVTTNSPAIAKLGGALKKKVDAAKPAQTTTTASPRFQALSASLGAPTKSPAIAKLGDALKKKVDAAKKSTTTASPRFQALSTTRTTTSLSTTRTTTHGFHDGTTASPRFQELSTT